MFCPRDQHGKGQSSLFKPMRPVVHIMIIWTGKYCWLPHLPIWVFNACAWFIWPWG
jgi:hypothetical protein